MSGGKVVGFFFGFLRVLGFRKLIVDNFFLYFREVEVIIRRYRRLRVFCIIMVGVKCEGGFFRVGIIYVGLSF